MYKPINIYEYMNHILAKLQKGILVTTKHEETVNTMSISWGKIGIEWNRPIFALYVRQSRHTFKMLESNEFTINIPQENDFKNVISRNTKKIKDMQLKLMDGHTISTPGIKELPLTLECKVIYKQDQDLSLMEQDMMEQFYKKSADGIRDYHTVFFGEIVDAYIIE